MKKNLYLFTVIALLFLGGSLAVLTYGPHRSEQATPKSEFLAQELVNTHQEKLTPQIIKQAYKEALDGREQNIRQEIVDKTGIALESWMEYKEACTVEFTNQEHSNFNNDRYNGTAISEKTKKTIRPIMRQLGINPTTIYLITTDVKHSAAAAGSSSIYINEQLFDEKTPSRKMFTIAHELTHLQFQDGAEQEALELLLKEQHGTLTSADKELVNALSRFHEERADIYALLEGKEFREGAIDSFVDWKKIHGNRTAPTHPTFAQREAVARAVDFAFNNSTTRTV